MSAASEAGPGTGAGTGPGSDPNAAAPARAATPADVLAFWFGDPPARQPRREWFAKDAGFDALVRQRFAALLARAVSPLEPLPAEWSSGAQATLAQVVLLDQLTRNAWRDTPKAFAGDAKALALARGLVDSGQDRALAPFERWFAYLPFEHAEDRGAQAQSLRLFGALAAEHPALADALVWARRHAAVIERFGRYPHRNLVLGRISTPEEIAFLREPGSSF